MLQHFDFELWEFFLNFFLDLIDLRLEFLLCLVERLQRLYFFIGFCRVLTSLLDHRQRRLRYIWVSALTFLDALEFHLYLLFGDKVLEYVDVRLGFKLLLEVGFDESLGSLCNLLFKNPLECLSHVFLIYTQILKPVQVIKYGVLRDKRLEALLHLIFH